MGLSKGRGGAVETTSAVLFYCVCSAGMLLVNKLAVHHVPLPALVTASQFVFASSIVYSCKVFGMLEMDDFEWDKAKYFLIYVLSFSIGTYLNMKVLSMANVETVIVFRSCAPIAVAGFDYIFYNRAFPSLRSCAALLLVTAGAISYILHDREFHVNGLAAYTWAMLWWVVLVFQLTYGKFLVTGIPLKSLWTPVLYTNTFSIAPACFICLLTGELAKASAADAAPISGAGLGWLVLSCLIGLCISWAGFWAQTLITATTYTVVGVMNKMLTISVNVLIWDKHASTAGLASLGCCLLGGSLYQQAPLRTEAAHDVAEMSQLRGSDGSEPDSASEARSAASPRRCSRDV